MNLIERCRHGLMIYNKKDIWQGKSYDTYGEYSESEVDIFREIIRPGNAVMDVGANIGSLTLPLARLVGPGGMVVSLEPERNNFFTLCGNVAINNLRNVWCFQQAISNLSGIIDVPEIDYDNTVNFGGIELDRDYSNASHYPVTKNTIDNIAGGEWRLIKIDVEGMEQNVLEGAAATIDRFKPIIYVEDDREQKSGMLRDTIENMGYVMYRHEAPFFNPKNFFEYPYDVFGNIISLNLLCHHKDTPCPVDIEKFKLIAVRQ